MNYAKLGVSRVINAAGMMTALGGATLHADVVAAMAAGARWNVAMDQLKDRAGELVARYAGAEAGMVTTGASAGIAIMCAAVVAGADEVRLRQLPQADWDPREVLLQAGHAVSFGGPVTQMMRIGGAVPVLVGDVNQVTPGQVKGHIGPKTAAFLYVQSHHTVHKGMQGLEAILSACHQQGVPVLVDAAAEEDLQHYIRLGADLVTYSGGKAFGGPTSGLIVGKGELIRACRAQEGGIARPMKVGKETILGLLAALERYVHTDADAEKAAQLLTVAALEEALYGLPGTTLLRLPDEAGRAIIRVGLQLDERALSFSAAQLYKGLQQGSPAVVLRGHQANTGTVAIDPRNLEPADVPVVASAIRTFYARHGREA
jgi:D-glucosaminate-6-phosphate ammonia-lyase